MDELQRKTILKETFDTVSGGYDNKSLRFFADSARHMAMLLGPAGRRAGARRGVWHRATRRWLSARLLPRGRVTAIDFSHGMLKQARKKAALLAGIRTSSFSNGT